MGSSNISARIDDKVFEKLEKLAKATNRSKSFLAAEAINKYVDEQSWQIEAINKAVKEADKDNFATDKEIKEYFSKWGINED